MYAIVDIETTGGSAKKHRITEVAVIVHDGRQEISRYQRLVNPQALIPRSITELTGITNEMVADAPTFEEIQEELYAVMDGHVFVAHNVNFDYGFLREHFAQCGVKWHPKRLCTVRLSRKILPGMYSYSLGKLAQQLGYSIEDRHRAMGDCDFTATLFKMLIEKDAEGHVAFALNARSREATIPPLLNREIVERIPASMGVYIFYGQRKKVLYVGKANNLRHRVSEHFRGNTHTGYKNRFAEQIADVQWIECPNELIALLAEAREIKRYWPPYNNLMKRISLNWGIFTYTDQNGYDRLSVGRVGKWDKPVHSFRNQYEARFTLQRLRNEYELCARFCDLQPSGGHCAEEVHGKCRGACVGDEEQATYNRRMADAIRSLSQEGRTLVIRGKGMSAAEHSVVLLQQGRYKGFGMMPADQEVRTLDDIEAYIQTGYDDQDMQAIILQYLQKNGDQDVVYL